MVIGVGLIGGSVALALKARRQVGEVVGVGRSRANLATALESNVIDRGLTLEEPWTRELADADIVLLATPVAQFPQLLAAMAAALGKRTVVTDAGSTKQDVVNAAVAHLGSALPRFVPAHPIAGTENSGAGAAFASLYEGRDTIVTPLPLTDPQALASVHALWELCGARVLSLAPAVHDRIFAAVSHLPHLVASVYMAELAGRSDAGTTLGLAGTGFRDFTRIAAASPEMWRDITLANRDALLDELNALGKALESIRSSLQSSDRGAIERLFCAASEARRAWSRTSTES